MTSTTLAAPMKQVAKYHLTEAVRLQIIQESSINPSAEIPHEQLMQVEEERLRFMELNDGDDGFFCS